MSIAQEATQGETCYSATTAANHRAQESCCLGVTLGSKGNECAYAGAAKPASSGSSQGTKIGSETGANTTTEAALEAAASGRVDDTTGGAKKLRQSGTEKQSYFLHGCSRHEPIS